MIAFVAAVCFLAVECNGAAENSGAFSNDTGRSFKLPLAIGPSHLSCDSNHSCPVGFYCSHSSTNQENYCECHQPHDRLFYCDSKYKFSVLDCVCATFNPESNLVSVGACVYNCEKNTRRGFDLVYHTLPNSSLELNVDMCGYLNRNGTLCGSCFTDYYPLAYSFNLTCIPCPHPHWNWLWYIMAAYLPLTLFYFFILFFKINAVSSLLYPVVFYSQSFSIPALSRVLFLALQDKPIILKSVKVVLFFHGIWNLDFGKSFYSNLCLGVGPLPILALDYAIAVYPLLLMVVSYLLITLYDRNYRVVITIWSPFRRLFFLFRRNWDIRTSVIDSYATFFLLSNVKVLSVSFDLLVPTKVYHLFRDQNNNYSFSLFYAGDIPYFGEQHLPYAILAIVVSSVFVILPLFLLVLYPFTFFQKFLNLFPFRWYILYTFMDSFQGCFKDGTRPGTRDCRWFASLFFLYRVILFVIYASVLNGLYFPFSSIIILLFVLLLVVVQPYKDPNFTKFSAAFLVLYAMLYVLISGGDIASIKSHGNLVFFTSLAYLLSLVPLFCAGGFVVYFVYSRRRFGLSWVRAWGRGYVELEESGNDFGKRTASPQAENEGRSCAPDHLRACA